MAIGLFALLIMILSIRDGILCLQGRMQEMNLQLLGFLKQRIHGVIRGAARKSPFVMAAFGTGAIISVLELACTGQVYGPTILYMLHTGRHFWDALFYLFLYNAAFILPLAAVFGCSYYGMTSTSLLTLFRRHASVVKFATAGLFFFMFVFFIFGNWIRTQF